jgi:tetratricopeptide (TPR) repeat protein
MLPTSAEQLDALLATAEAARAASTLPEGLAAAKQAWGQTPPADRVRRQRAGLLLTHFLYRTGALKALLEVGLELLPLLRGGPDAPATVPNAAALVDLLRMVSLSAADSARFELALSCADEARAVAVASGDQARESLAINVMGCCMERMGDPWGAERLMHESLALARVAEEAALLRGAPLRDAAHPRFVAPNNLCGALIGAFYLLRDSSTADEAVAALRRALPYAREAMALADSLGDEFFRTFVRGNVGEILVHLGELGEAQDLLARTLASAQRGGAQAQVWRITCSLGELQLLRGEHELAWQTLSEALATSAHADPRMTHLRLHHALWRTARALQKPADALHHLERYQQLEHERALGQLRAQSQRSAASAPPQGPDIKRA